jgi:hypothetical protein
VNVPAYLVAGWYDIFLNQQLADYAALKANGANPYLVIGPWMHFNRMNGMQIGTTVGMRWFDHHLKGKRLPAGKPVQVYVMGSNRWRELDQFPPRHQARTWYMQDDRLLEHTPETSGTRTYRYDPHRPTPSHGGMAFTTDLKPVKDNRVLEKRRDVLTFTSIPLTAPLEIIGTVLLELFYQSTRPTTDFFVRLTDVYPGGRSMTVADGFVRVYSGADQGSQSIEIQFAPTAYRFAPFHRLRLIVASGAYPNYMRNFGTDEPLFDVERGMVADQTIYYGEETPTRLTLPIYRGW